MPKHPKRPRDPNQLAHTVVGIATGEIEERDPNVGKDAAAAELGRRGGLKGGRARANALTPEERAAVARKAAAARWSKS
ncbi:MAG: histone H1 [Rhodospirillales bacterium]|nr:histone H1 [Rhodospirillales bacterium]